MIKTETINIPLALLHSELSVKAKWLYLCLCEIECRLCSSRHEAFIQKNDDLCEMSGMSLPTLKKAKAELRKTKFIECWVSSIKVNRHGELSTEHFTHYRIKEYEGERI